MDGKEINVKGSNAILLNDVDNIIIAIDTQETMLLLRPYPVQQKQKVVKGHLASPDVSADLDC